MAAHVNISFKCPAFYDLYATSHAHGWRYLAPFSWDEDKRMLRFAVFVDESSVDIECSQNGKSIQANLSSHNRLSSRQVDDIRKMIRRALCLDMHTDRLLEKAERIHPEFAKLIKKGAGRMLRSPTLWEDAAKTLFTTNCTWALTQKMCESMCSDRFSSRTPCGAYPFPVPNVFAKYSPEQLREIVCVGYRAGYVTALAESFTEDPYLRNLETDGHDYATADRIVRNLKGFADYACAHLLVLAGYFEKIPVDTTVVSFLKENYRVRKPQSFIARHYRKWGEDRWWGYQLDRILTLKRL